MSKLARKQLNFRGVKFRAWLYFMLFALLIVAFMFSMQMLIFRFYYANMKENEVKSAIVRMNADYGTPYFAQSVRSAGFLIGNVYVFRMNGTEPDLIAMSERGAVDVLDEEALSKLIAAYTRLVQSNSDFTTFVTNDEEDTLNIVSEIRKGNARVYYLVQTPYTMTGVVSNVLTTQMTITTVMSVVISVLLSLLLSRKFAEPIIDLTRSAKRLAKGDFDTRFKTSGYSEIDDLANTLNYATAEMKKSDELRKDLIANISHELRTPLTMIKAYAEMIRDLSGDRPKKRNEHLKVILDETDRLAALVSDILDLSRIESGATEPDRTVFDLARLVKDICARFEGMYAPEGYTLVTELSDTVYVAADYKQIGQVVYNLVGNALNYVGEDKQIIVALVKDGHKVTFRVSDHGKGIALEDRKHIWDRYFRSQESKRTKIGSGIGLSIVKGICEAHGLEYGVDSVMGEGSSFYVRFEQVEPI